jgi:hypothetical protein
LASVAFGTASIDRTPSTTIDIDIAAGLEAGPGSGAQGSNLKNQEISLSSHIRLAATQLIPARSSICPYRRSVFSPCSSRCVRFVDRRLSYFFGHASPVFKNKALAMGEVVYLTIDLHDNIIGHAGFERVPVSNFKRPSGTQVIFAANPAINRRATFGRPSGTPAALACAKRFWALTRDVLSGPRFSFPLAWDTDKCLDVFNARPWEHGISIRDI